MNGYPTERELPELTDEQIKLLDSICKAASGSVAGPFRALFYQYDRLSQEQDLDTSRDNAVYRWMLRVGEKARRDQRVGQRTDFVPYLRSLLAAHGITVIDEEENEGSDVAIHSSDIPNATRDSRELKLSRRVSFDDARLEETWLSGRSLVEKPQTLEQESDPLQRIPYRERNFVDGQRARPASSERFPGPRQPAPKHFQDTSPSSEYTSEYEEPRNPTLFFEPSFTQLEQNADAFYATSEWRYARHCLRKWHEQAKARQAEYARAVAYDQNYMFRDSMNHLDISFRFLKRERILGNMLINYQNRRMFQLLDRSFSHWHASALYQVRVNEHTRIQLLGKRYFTRWRNFAVESATKTRSIILRKHLKLWRERKMRRALVHEQADAHYEETLERRCVRLWFWKHKETSIEGQHDRWRLHAAIRSWRSKMNDCRTQGAQASSLRNQRLVSFAFHRLAGGCEQHHGMVSVALSHHANKLASQYLQILHIQAKLAPIAGALSDKLDTNLKRRILRTLVTHMEVEQQATAVDRKRILQSAWTAWNDKLRYMALARRVDQRILMENLRRWLLRSRMEIFRRSRDSKLLSETFMKWRNNARERQSRLEQALTNFEEGQRRRQMKFGTISLNSAMRERENANRAAVEHYNGKLFPNGLTIWITRTEHARQLARWATDARFYCLCTRTLKVWRERVTERKQQRRREAYAHVRAKVKARIVRNCYTRMKNNLAELLDKKNHAKDMAQARLFRIGTTGFDTWREKAMRSLGFRAHAMAVDREKLLSSAFTAMISRQQDQPVLEEWALAFRQESDAALLASTLKKMQWLVFTASRSRESADALCKRNQDQHLRYLLRYWASQAVKKRAAKEGPMPQDPESPSLRPASRAASRSAARPGSGSSPSVPPKTLAYMRTPSRSRKVARFRPLPTPAHMTPMAFDRGYFVTTPAPLGLASMGEGQLGPGDFLDGLTPQITPFARKLRAGGVTPAPQSVLRSSILGKSMAGTSKSVRFAGSSRFDNARLKPDAPGE